jgi:hypothetical protein
MLDERARYFRRLRRLRGAARRWTVLTGGFLGAAAVLAPYQGLGALDALWAGLAGASAGLTWWRWSDARQLAAQPVPDPPDPALAGDRWLSQLAQVPGGYGLAEVIRRQRTRGALRGSTAAQVWERLDRAARSLRGLTPRMRDAPEGTLTEAGRVEQGLRELTNRVATLEQSIRLAPPDAQPHLRAVRDAQVAQLEQGVAAYEQFVVAAAGWLAESERLGRPDPGLAGLTDATDRLRGVTQGLAELRAAEGSLRLPG